MPPLRSQTHLPPWVTSYGAPERNNALLLPIKHSRLVVALTRAALRARARRLERVVFTATTGRSGTKTLANLFARLGDCVAFHEPYPTMSGEVLRRISYGDEDFAARVYWRIKSVNILRAAQSARYYFEANHCFTKTFAEHALRDFGDKLAVVHLVRPPIEVASSIYRLQDYPGTVQGNNWWLDHRAPTNLIKLSQTLDRSADFAHPFYKALWYWHEMELRIATLQHKYPALPFVRFETRHLNEPAQLAILLRQLGIEYRPSDLEALGITRKNARDDSKLVDAPTYELAVKMLYRFRRLLQQKGIDVSVFGRPEHDGCDR